MSFGYVAFVDEAGDDGIGQFRAAGVGGQSHWLVLAACIIPADIERNVVAWRDEIARAFPSKKKPGLHFRELNHEQRLFAASRMGSFPLGLIAITSYKPTIVGTGMAERCRKEKNLLYKYLLRYLIEKITWTVHRRHARRPSGNGKVRIVFSRRGGMDYEDFVSYLNHLKGLQEARGGRFMVNWNCLDEQSIAIDVHSKSAGLQIADIAASSFFQALEVNAYGMTEPRYALALRDSVVAGDGGSKLYYGVKPVPSIGRMTLTPDQHAFFRSWVKKG